MSFELTFGEFKGLTIERVFFDAPWYARWLKENRTLSNRYDYDDEERCYFNELYDRASCLAGTCARCKERPVEGMSLSWVGFYCDECERSDVSIGTLECPSFFVQGRPIPRFKQLNITAAIKKHYIGGGNLTQKRMEDFFYRDGNFKHASPDFLALYYPRD